MKRSNEEILKVMASVDSYLDRSNNDILLRDVTCCFAEEIIRLKQQVKELQEI